MAVSRKNRNNMNKNMNKNRNNRDKKTRNKRLRKNTRNKRNRNKAKVSRKKRMRGGASKGQGPFNNTIRMTEAASVHVPIHSGTQAAINYAGKFRTMMDLFNIKRDTPSEKYRGERVRPLLAHEYPELVGVLKSIENNGKNPMKLHNAKSKLYELISKLSPKDVAIQTLNSKHIKSPVLSNEMRNIIKGRPGFLPDKQAVKNSMRHLYKLLLDAETQAQNELYPLTSKGRGELWKKNRHQGLSIVGDYPDLTKTQYIFPRS